MVLLRYSKKLYKNRHNSGFTLIELLISSFIGVIIIGAAGYGLMNLLRNSRSNTVQSNKRTEFNRATEFISDEMRRADTIDVNPTAAYDAVFTGAGAITPPANAQPVLAINIPGVRRPSATVDNPIIYFVSDPAGGDTGVWNGPKVIYRYGPPLDANGDFTNKAWSVEPLVDGISDNNIATPSCDSGWTASPTTNAKGFYACILPTSVAAKGETAKLFAIGQLDSTNSSNGDYQVSTQVYARAEAETLDGSDPDVAYSGACVLSFGALVCPGGGTRTYDIERISDSFACKSDGTKWKVLVTAYYIDTTTSPPQEQYFTLDGTSTSSQDLDLSTSGLNFKFTTDKNPLFRVTPDVANSTGCTGTDVFSSASQNQNPVDSTTASASIPQFMLLEDADVIPDELTNSAFEVDGSTNVQQDAVAILTTNNLVDPKQTNKINTGNNYLVAFEIGQTNKYKSDGKTPNPGYDFQDQMFKINVQ